MKKIIYYILNHKYHIIIYLSLTFLAKHIKEYAFNGRGVFFRAIPEGVG